MNLILLGTPGAGKGTQAKLLADRLHLRHISSGELLRKEVGKKTKKGLLIKKIMDEGELVPFDTVLDVILSEIKLSPEGFILDGTPRDLAQAEHMDWFFKNNDISIDAVIYYELDDPTSLARLSNRAKEEHRTDDTPETHRHRLDVYHKETAPVIDYYRDKGKLITVDARPDIETILEQTLKVLPKA